KRLNVINKALRDTTYEALQAESRDIVVSIPLGGKVCQAGSYGFLVLRTGNITKQAYLYMEMLRILTMVCGHKKADLAHNQGLPHTCENLHGLHDSQGLRASSAIVLKSEHH
ncbi:MAG: hypothetical protein ACKPKO_09090, partial [Candidatus Fonsibacter sp.]